MDKAVAMLAAGRVLQILIALLSVRVMTTVLPASEVGNYYLIFTILSFFSLVLINPVGVYQNRKTHLWVDEMVLYNRLFIFNGYLLLICLLTLPTVYCLHELTGFGSSIPLVQLMLFVLIGLFCTTWNQSVIPLLNLLQHRISFVILSTISLALGLSLSALLVFAFFEASAVVWVSGQAIAQALISVFAFYYLRKIVPAEFNLGEVRTAMGGQNLRNVLQFTLPLAATTLLMWLQSQSYRIIVEQRAGLEFLGMIGLGLGIASNIAAAVESLVHQLYMPVFYHEINTADAEVRTQAWNRMAQLTLPIFVSLAIFVSALSPFLIELLAHDRFAGAWLFIAFGAWIELCRMTTGILSSVAHAEMQTKYLIKSYFVGGLMALVGVWIASKQPNARILIPAALLISGIASTGMMHQEMKKLIRTKVGIRAIIRSTLLSIPFFLAIPLAMRPHGMFTAFAVVAVMGTYFLFIQYRLAHPYLQRASK